MRVVLDTNILVSFLIGKSASSLKPVIINRRIMLLFSQELLEELVAVIHRPKFRRYFSPENVRELLLLLDTITSTVKITSNVTARRDTRDNFLLAL